MQPRGTGGHEAFALWVRVRQVDLQLCPFPSRGSRPREDMGFGDGSSLKHLDPRSNDFALGECVHQKKSMNSFLPRKCHGLAEVTTQRCPSFFREMRCRKRNLVTANLSALLSLTSKKSGIVSFIGVIHSDSPAKDFNAGSKFSILLQKVPPCASALREAEEFLETLAHAKRVRQLTGFPKNRL